MKDRVVWHCLKYYTTTGGFMSSNIHLGYNHSLMLARWLDGMKLSVAMQNLNWPCFSIALCMNQALWCRSFHFAIPCLELNFYFDCTLFYWNVLIDKQRLIMTNYLIIGQRQKRNTSNFWSQRELKNRMWFLRCRACTVIFT